MTLRGEPVLREARAVPEGQVIGKWGPKTGNRERGSRNREAEAESANRWRGGLEGGVVSTELRVGKCAAGDSLPTTPTRNSAPGTATRYSNTVMSTQYPVLSVELSTSRLGRISERGAAGSL